MIRPKGCQPTQILVIVGCAIRYMRADKYGWKNDRFIGIRW